MALKIRSMMCSLAVLFGIAGFAVPIHAQDDLHAACFAPPRLVPAELLKRPVPLRSGIGNSHEPVTTRSSDAQAFYNQGLNYLESYVWIEAARSFHQALRLDPELAMAYVGLSRVCSGFNDTTGARLNFLEAKARSAKITEPERRRIAIRELQLAALVDLESPAKHVAYKKAIDDALASGLSDPQLWLLRGNAEEPNASGRGQRGTASSVAFYEKVLQLVPDHASAHHYLVHSFESIGRIDLALEHGAEYARLAPAIPHAAHMWGHDLRRVGRIDEAIEQFRKADSLERAYYAAEKIEAKFDWHHGHNLGLLATCYEHKGQMKLAEQTMRDVWALGPEDPYLAFNLRELPNFLIHRERYPEALEASRTLVRTRYPVSRAVGHALAGQALVGLGRIEPARTELDSARHELEMIPRILPGVLPSRGAVEPWVDGLEGELLLRTGGKEQGRALLKKVEATLRAQLGPDAWIQTLFRLETIARSAREAGDWELAEHTAREMIQHDSAYGGSHFALALVFKHRGDRAGAAREFEEARRYWREADADLPELAQIASMNAGR